MFSFHYLSFLPDCISHVHILGRLSLSLVQQRTKQSWGSRKVVTVSCKVLRLRGQKCGMMFCPESVLQYEPRSAEVNRRLPVVRNGPLKSSSGMSESSRPLILCNSACAGRECRQLNFCGCRTALCQHWSICLHAPL